MIAFHLVSNSNPMLAVTLQIQNKELPTGVDIGPVREGQHHLFQQADGSNLVSIVVVVLPKFTSHVLLNGQPLVCWMAVDEENFQEPVDINTVCQELARWKASSQSANRKMQSKYTKKEDMSSLAGAFSTTVGTKWKREKRLSWSDNSQKTPHLIRKYSLWTET